MKDPGKSTDDVRIRLATEGDAATLHRMVVELATATRPGRKVSSRPEDFERHASSFDALIAEQEGTAVGFCLFIASFSSWRGEPGVYVQDLYVAPVARSSGLGRKLMSYTARLARSRGASWLRLSVEADNVTGREFYRRIGMTHAENECIYQAVDQAFDRLAAEGDEL